MLIIDFNLDLADEFVNQLIGMSFAVLKVNHPEGKLMKIKKQNSFSSEAAQRKKKERYLQYSLIFLLVLVAVLFAVPYINLVAIPVILVIGALLLLYILWRQRQPKK